jgi:glyoxylase-like metal-dependent hydrolase (beta-lactamase superfamily II)
MMQITEHVHAIGIPVQIPVAQGKTFERFVCVYLILGTEICLIDSGAQNAYGAISGYLKNLGRKPEEISLLVLTHAHPDHIGSALEIKKAAKCNVAAHRDVQTWVEDVALQFKKRRIPGFHSLVGGSTPVDRLLHEGEIVDLGGPVSLEVILTPGHATGARFTVKRRASCFQVMPSRKQMTCRSMMMLPPQLHQ